MHISSACSQRQQAPQPEPSMLTAIPLVSEYESEEVNMLKLLATNSNLHTELKEAGILAAQRLCMHLVFAIVGNQIYTAR